MGQAQARPTTSPSSFFGGYLHCTLTLRALTSGPPKNFYDIMDFQSLNNNNQLRVHPFYTTSCFVTLVAFVNHIVAYVDIHSSMNLFALVLQPYSWLGRIEELLLFVGTWHAMSTLADVHTYRKI